MSDFDTVHTMLVNVFFAPWITIWTAIAAVSAAAYFFTTAWLLLLTREQIKDSARIAQQSLAISQQSATAALEAAQASRLQAEASAESAKTAKLQYEASRESFLAERRPLLYISAPRFTLIDFGPIDQRRFEFGFTLTNSGGTPAQTVRWDVTVNTDQGSLPIQEATDPNEELEVIPGLPFQVSGSDSSPASVNILLDAQRTVQHFVFGITVTYLAPLEPGKGFVSKMEVRGWSARRGGRPDTPFHTRIQAVRSGMLARDVPG